MSANSHYDVAILGAGMSGLAAGIRLAHFGKKVCIFERHNAPGGLNGFYSFDGRKFDVGLHAMTNYVPPGTKGTPLTKLLRQLRIDREELDLCPQGQSRVNFLGRSGPSLRFTNEFAVFEAEVERVFPSQIDGFRRLLAQIKAHDDVSLEAAPLSARSVVRSHLSDPLLEDMLFCPLMYYGSSSEHDMDFGQFVIMFKALFLEGFARPFDGVRVILRVLLEKYRQAGGERRMKCGVRRLRPLAGGAIALTLDSGEELTASQVLSSIGSAETEALLREEAALPAGADQERRLSFVETITVLRQEPASLGCGEDTIIFFNDSERFHYERPETQVDVRSGVICMPNNFRFGEGRRLPEGLFRLTCLANYDRWNGLSPEAYQADKARWFQSMRESALRFLPEACSAETLARETLVTDMFTPLTITRFTGHHKGAIYGAVNKARQGRSSVPNVFLCGTDQGFLGITGAMLSGISMANFHILRGGA